MTLPPPTGCALLNKLLDSYLFRAVSSAVRWHFSCPCERDLISLSCGFGALEFPSRFRRKSYASQPAALCPRSCPAGLATVIGRKAQPSGRRDDCPLAPYSHGPTHEAIERSAGGDDFVSAAWATRDAANAAPGQCFAILGGLPSQASADQPHCPPRCGCGSRGPSGAIPECPTDPVECNRPVGRYCVRKLLDSSSIHTAPRTSGALLAPRPARKH